MTPRAVSPSLQGPLVGVVFLLPACQVRLNRVQPEAFVPFVNFSSASRGDDSGGALLLTVFVINPFGGSLEVELAWNIFFNIQKSVFFKKNVLL